MYSISIHMVPEVLDWATYSGQHFVSIVKILQQHGNLRLIRGSGKKLPKSPLDALHDASSQYLRKERDSGCVRPYPSDHRILQHHISAEHKAEHKPRGSGSSLFQEPPAESRRQGPLCRLGEAAPGSICGVKEEFCRSPSFMHIRRKSTLILVSFSL